MIYNLRAYRKRRLKSVSSETVNLEFRHLKAIFNAAINLDYLRVNPFVRIKPIRIPQSDLPRFFELEDIQKIREGFSRHSFRDLLEFYLLIGARLKEPLSLTWKDIDFRRKIITVRSINTKSKRHRIISFEDDKQLSHLLSNLSKREDNLLFGPKDTQPQWTSWWVSRNFSKTFTRIGSPWATVHTCRHTYISHLIRACRLRLCSI